MRTVSILVFFVLAALLGIVASARTNLDEQIYIGSLALVAVLIACLLSVANGAPIQTLFNMRLGAWFFGYAVIAYGLSTITILDSEWVSPQISLSWIPKTLLLLAVAFLVATIGYHTRLLSEFLGLPIRGVGLFLVRKRSFRPRTLIALYAVFALGVFADVIKVVLTGQYGYLGSTGAVTSQTAAWYVQPLIILSAAKYAAISALTISTVGKRIKEASLLLIPVLAIATLLGILTGMKESFLDVVLAVLLPWIFLKKRIPVFGTIVAGLVFVLVVTPFITQLRGEVRGNSVLNVQEGGTYAISQLFSLDSYLAETDSAESAAQVASRIRLIDNLALIQANTPSSIPYRDPKELVSAPLTGVVPRAIWSDKPVRLAGYDFYKTFYRGQGESSSAITPQGSLFMFGGIPVLLLGMFLIGAVLRAVDDSLNALSNPQSTILLVLFASVVVKQELDVPGFLASIPIMVLTWIMAVFLVFRSRGIHEA
ncbi:hypothetical protein [Glutamicibacter sp. BSL13]